MELFGLFTEMRRIATAVDGAKKSVIQAMEDGLQRWIESEGEWRRDLTKRDDRPASFHFAPTPSTSRIVAATAIHTAVAAPLEVATALLDILRIGEGVEGFASGDKSAFGLAEDGLRVLPLAGLVGRTGTRLAVTLARAHKLPQPGSSLQWLMTDPNLPNCAWVSAAMALRLTGVKHYALTTDIARAAGISIEHTAAAGITSFANVLEKLGASIVSHHFVAGSGSIRHVEAQLRRLLETAPKAVAMFSVRANDFAHAMVAHRDVAGRVRFFDRPGTTGQIRASYSLEELALRYPGYSGAAPHFVPEVLLVDGAKVAALEHFPAAMRASADLTRLGAWGLVALEVKLFGVELYNRAP